MQEAHSEQNSKEGVIREFVAREVLPDWDKRSITQRRMYWQADFQKDNVQRVRRSKVCAAEIWCECFGGDLRNMRRSDSVEINSVLQNISGWDKSPKAIRFGAEYGVQKGFIYSEKL